MKNITRTLVTLSLVSASLLSTAIAQTNLSKSEAKEKAVAVCQTEAKQRYGEESVVTTANKAKWKKSLKGASVQVKVKPVSKRAAKYNCVLGLDSSVTFYKV